ncbi:MAG: imidazole glycerol phosphate synthase subunit HisF [Candidatus Omnitrophica bacterium]|nr:imidazole glycerol phosphate synthase subunit HisF [Candidatus Omnitrophota bacterium]
MKNIRIIPKLDIKGPNLVKGIHLEGLRVLGKPEHFARHYYENGADELIYIDVVASLYGRNSLVDIIRKTASEIFIPLTVGGGLRTLDDIKTVLRAGADKVAINTAAIKNPELIHTASKKFGSSTIVVSIEAIRHPDGKYYAYTDNGREYTGVEAYGWAVKAAELGAGEIMITSVDREGTGLGYDIELTMTISESVSVPVIACGGAGKLEHISQAIEQGKADAVCIASMLHYDFVESNSVKGDFSSEGNVEYLKSNCTFSKTTSSSLPDIKSFLKGEKCQIR